MDAFVLGEHGLGPVPPGSDKGEGEDASCVRAGIWGGLRPLVPWMRVL